MHYFKAENISKCYGEKEVIRNISLKANQGEIVALLGVSGIGKTTFFNVLAGLEIPDSGKVSLAGSDITGKSGIASYMQQKDLLLPYKTVLENVSLPLILKGMKRKIAYEQAESYFVQFGLRGTEKQYPTQLSGGMRQRAALLRSYLFSSKLMLLDEPFSALDAITKNDIHDWYLEIVKNMKTTTVFITHDLDEAILLADHIYIMGGSPGEVVHHFAIDTPKTKTNAYTTTDNFIMYKKEILQKLKCL